MKTGDMVVIGVLGFIGLRMLSGQNGGKNPLEGLLSGGINIGGFGGAPTPGGSGGTNNEGLFSGFLDALRGLLGGAGTGGGTRYSGAGGGGSGGNVFSIFDTALKTIPETIKTTGDETDKILNTVFSGTNNALGNVNKTIATVGDTTTKVAIGGGILGATYLAVKYGGQVAPAAGRLSGSILDRITGAISKGGPGGNIQPGMLGLVIGSPLFPSAENPDPLHIFGSLAPKKPINPLVVRSLDVSINQAVLSRMGLSAGAVSGAVAMFAPNYNAPVLSPYTGIGGGRVPTTTVVNTQYGLTGSGSPPAGFTPYTENGLTPAQQATYNAMMTGA